ncbi:MAG: ATP synthase F0 subunit B [Candidatus Riflemargulisbacteria bacterium]
MESTTNSLLIVWNLIAFLLMLFVVRYAIWPKLIFFIDERKKKIEGMQASYEKRNKEILELTEKIKSESIAAAERRKKILYDTKHECAELRLELIQKAHTEATFMIDRAHVEIVKEKNKAFADVRKDVSIIISKSIKQVLYNIVDEDIDKKVNEEIIKVVTSVE